MRRRRRWWRRTQGMGSGGTIATIIIAPTIVGVNVIWSSHLILIITILLILNILRWLKNSRKCGLVVDNVGEKWSGTWKVFFTTILTLTITNTNTSTSTDTITITIFTITITITNIFTVTLSPYLMTSPSSLTSSTVLFKFLVSVILRTQIQRSWMV